MTSRLKIGAATAGVITLITGGSYGIALGWNVLETIGQGKELSQNAAAFEAMKSSFEKQGATLDKLSTSQDDMKIQQARQGAILELISPQLGVNPRIVDTFPSTTRQ